MRFVIDRADHIRRVLYVVPLDCLQSLLWDHQNVGNRPIGHPHLQDLEGVVPIGSEDVVVIGHHLVVVVEVLRLLSEKHVDTVVSDLRVV